MDQKVFIANELVRDSATSLLPYERAKQIKVIIGSWNVNASIEDISNLDTWIPPLDHSTGQRFDLIVIGLQEMIELSATNVVGSTVASMADERASKWQSLLLDYLQASSYCSDAINESAGSSGALGIRLVAACHLVGIWIGVFARESLLPDIRNVETGTVPCGAGGMLGNKGASCIRMDICDTSICFACAHLAANQNSVSKRNDDFNTIMSKGVFMDDKISSVLAIKSDSMQTMAATKVKTQLEGIRKQINKTEFSKNNYSNALSELSQKVPLGDHDLLFFFGDLNYRINENNRMLDDMYKIMQEDLELLKVDDQLNIERKSGRVFQGFAEGPLTFLPTYKFIAGTDEYDRRPEKKMRVPAWCDRILWRIGKSKHVSSAAVGSSSGSFEVSAQVDTELYTRDDDVPGSSRVVCNLIEQVEQLTYQRCDNIISDHRPIRSSFNVTVKSISKVDKEGMLSDIYHRCMRENFSFVTASPSFVYMRCTGQDPVTTAICIVNTSSVFPAELRVNSHSVPRWLEVYPTVFDISPSDKVHITFKFLPKNASETLTSDSCSTRFELNTIIDMGLYDSFGVRVNIPVSVLATL